MGVAKVDFDAEARALSKLRQQRPDNVYYAGCAELQLSYRCQGARNNDLVKQAARGINTFQ